MISFSESKSISSNASIKYSIQKGRVGRKTSSEKKLYGPPKGEPWIWLSTELLLSTAWRSMSINCHKLIFHLIIEHSQHAGRENGRLLSTYIQLQHYGLTRNKIRAAIEEAEFLGLIRHKRGRKIDGCNQPNTYRLTFYPDDEHGYATNQWKSITEEKVQNWKNRNGQLKKKIDNLKRK